MAKKPQPDSHVTFELSDHLPYLFKHIHSQLEVASAGKLARFGVNVAVWRILAVLWEHDTITHRELAHLTSIEVSTLSRVSKVVQRDGLIRRKRTQADQRSVRVTLTEKGRALAQSIIPWAVKIQEELFANIPAEDIVTLTRILNDVSKNLNRYTEADLDIVGESVEKEGEALPRSASDTSTPRTPSGKGALSKPNAKKAPVSKVKRAPQRAATE